MVTLSWRTVGGTKYEIEIYTTNAGKEKRGVWMASKSEAMKYSARAFTHSSNKGKWFVDEYWFPKDSVISKPSFSRRSASGNLLPDVVIGHKLGELSSHPDYAAAKAGDTEAALRIALDMVDDAMIEAVRKAAKGADVIIPVVSVEATGRNKIPLAVAEVLADRLGATAESQIVQADSPKRTSMDGLSRLLSSPVFDGPVQAGASYVLVDDTVTQGGTFASLASHIRDNGGEVSAVVALTGKQYSAKLALNPVLLSKVRERFKSVEDKFKAATGYGFDALTESEARYLAKHDDAQSVRDRITEAGNAASLRENEGNARFSTASQTSSSSLTASQVTGIVDAIKARWANAPDIVVVESMDDPAIPQAVRDENAKQQSKGTTGEPEGFYYGRKVYVVASTMSKPADVIRVLFHETLGHAGLRGVFGDSLKPILRQIVTMRRKEVAAKAEQYGLDMNKLDDALQAAEEVLAEMAHTKPDIGFVTRAVAAIRAFLRKHVPGFTGTKMTDAEIIQQFILPARRFVENGASGISASAPMFSRTKIVGETTRQHTPEQLRAMANVGFQVEVPTLKERAQALWKDAGKKLAQGIADQFAPIKDMDLKAYGLMRLAKGASGAFESLLHGGLLKLSDNVYDFDEQNRGGVIDKLLMPLQGEHHDFMRWVAANRAERLLSDGKEHLFSPQDVADMKTLATGQVAFDYTIQNGIRAGRTTRDRAEIYRDSLVTFNKFNKNVLDMAEQSGLIDGASRALWEHEFYVPFYRVADDSDGGVRGMNIKGGVVRQQAFKALKGGKNALNADLLDNTLMNWAHLIDASAKNRAAKATIEAAERLGVAMGGNQAQLAQMGASVNNKNGVVWFMDGGIKRYSLIDNQGDGAYLMTAITALEYAGMRSPIMNAMGFMKNALTVGVTASPFFKIRNLIRDSVQVIGTSGISANPLANVAQGWKLTNPKSDAYFRLLAGGGTIHFGTMLEGSEAKRVQSLVESGVDAGTILNDDHKVKAFYRKFIEPGITAYNELGNRGEAVNRASLYAQLVEQGMSHAEASLQARDLMDFSMQGSFTSIRFLAQVVPFFNARIQGMYKLGRAAKEDPARFSAVIGAAAVVSIGLLAAYSDDDDWKRRADWDRNNFWWFKFGGTAFRIPKPFEIGAVATMAERGFELAFEKEMTGTAFRKQVITLLGDNLSMNPIPQVVKPIVDVYANKDSFSGNPIESMSQQRLKSEYRFNDRTSMAARGLSTAMNSVTGIVGAESPSPVQIDHMLRGYFGWLGSFIVGAGDKLARPATSQAEQATPDYWKMVTGGMVSDLRDAPSKYVSNMYDQAKEIDQAYGTWKALVKQGDKDGAAAFAQDNKALLGKRHQVEMIKRHESKLNEQIRFIERSDIDGNEKRVQIRRLQNQKELMAKKLAPV